MHFWKIFGNFACNLDIIEMTSKYNYIKYQIYLKLKNFEKNEILFYFFDIVHLSCQGPKRGLLEYY